MYKNCKYPIYSLLLSQSHKKQSSYKVVLRKQKRSKREKFTSIIVKRRTIADYRGGLSCLFLTSPSSKVSSSVFSLSKIQCAFKPSSVASNDAFCHILTELRRLVLSRENRYVISKVMQCAGNVDIIINNCVNNGYIILAQLIT